MSEKSKSWRIKKADELLPGDVVTHIDSDGYEVTGHVNGYMGSIIRIGTVLIAVTAASAFAVYG